VVIETYRNPGKLEVTTISIAKYQPLSTPACSLIKRLARVFLDHFSLMDERQENPITLP
jgi:hypothetical protein